MISLKDAAQALGITQKSVTKLIDEGRLSSFRLGQQLYVQRKDVEELLLEEGRTPLHEPEGEDVLLSGLLSSSGIFHNVPGLTKAEVLRNALSLIHGIDPTEMGPIFEAFLQRENLGSTSIGHGIALPHARDVLIGYHTHPMLSLAFTASPVDWDTPDGIPVRAVFTQITPNGLTHLRILGKLSQILSDSNCREVISRQAPADEVLEVFRTVENRIGAMK
jgi:PTS system nitrogen regulatory IIA component